jgi:segregation and condensation protein B
MTDPTPTPAAPGGPPDPPPQGPEDAAQLPGRDQLGPQGATQLPDRPKPRPEEAAELPGPDDRGPEAEPHDAAQVPGPAQVPQDAAQPGPDQPEAQDPAQPTGPDQPGPQSTAELPGPDERRPEAGPVAGGVEGDPTAWPPDEAFDAVDLDDRGWTRRDLEAILLVADEPVPAAVLAEAVGSRLSEVEELLVDLAGEYARDGRGFVLRMIAGGWRLYTHPGAQTAVEAHLRAGQQSRLTRAALETLAVIAYRQPVTRFQVAAVRGVNVDGVFRTLASRGLIQEVGTDPGPGQAILYGTTPAFLEQLGLNDLDQLPPIKDYLPEGADLLDLQEQP